MMTIGGQRLPGPARSRRNHQVHEDEGRTRRKGPHRSRYCRQVPQPLRAQYCLLRCHGQLEASRRVQETRRLTR